MYRFEKNQYRSSSSKKSCKLIYEYRVSFAVFLYLIVFYLSVGDCFRRYFDCTPSIATQLLIVVCYVAYFFSFYSIIINYNAVVS